MPYCIEKMLWKSETLTATLTVSPTFFVNVCGVRVNVGFCPFTTAAKSSIAPKRRRVIGFAIFNSVGMNE